MIKLSGFILVIIAFITLPTNYSLGMHDTTTSKPLGTNDYDNDGINCLQIVEFLDWQSSLFNFVFPDNSQPISPYQTYEQKITQCEENEKYHSSIGESYWDYIQGISERTGEVIDKNYYQEMCLKPGPDGTYGDYCDELRQK